jgi:anaerobic ribonucleoside-triphosphate reductase activating protein
MKNDILSIAAWVGGTRVLGPGLRFALWLQGCPFCCPGCVAPEFQPMVSGLQMLVDDVYKLISSCQEYEGISISGGEPMIQAEKLSLLLKKIRKKSDLSVIVHTGFTFDELCSMSIKRPAIQHVLYCADVLIDGRYEHSLNDSKGLRGSANQNIIFLTKRYINESSLFESEPRKIEIHPYSDGIIMAGLPPLETWKAVVPDGDGKKWYNDFI